MDLARRLTELAKLRSPAGPVVSVYLDVRWADEGRVAARLRFAA